MGDSFYFFDETGEEMNKKQSKLVRRGYLQAGQLYWTDEMAAMLKKKNRELSAYRFGFFFCLAFAAGVAFAYAKAFW